MKKLIYLALFALISSLAYSQEDSTSSDGEFSILRTELGVKIIYNSDDSHFLFDIKCESFRQLDAGNMMYLADDVLLQITPVPLEYIMGGKIPNLNDSLALLYHFTSEMRNTRNNLSGDYKIDNEFIFGNNRLIFLWAFEMPAQKAQDKMETVEMQMFATTRAAGRVLMLAAVVVERNEPYDVRAKLIESLSSIVISDETIDPEEIRKTLIDE